MGFNFRRFREIGYDNYLGKIGPEFYVKIMPSTNKHTKKENIKDKFGKQGEGINKRPDISTMLSTEGGTQNYCIS